MISGRTPSLFGLLEEFVGTHQCLSRNLRMPIREGRPAPRQVSLSTRKGTEIGRELRQSVSRDELSPGVHQGRDDLELQPIARLADRCRIVVEG